MTKQEFLALAADRYESLQKLNDNLNFYDYEKGFEQIWTDLGRNILEKNIGEIPQNHQKKT